MIIFTAIPPPRSQIKIVIEMKITKCCAGRSAFGRRGTRRSQTARAWPRAAQHKWVACFNRAAFFKTAVFLFCFLLQIFFKTRVALPEATPSRFAISSFRYAPLRPANLLRACATHLLTITKSLLA